MNESPGNTDRRARKEAALFEAALDVFSALGYKKAGIEEIAQKAGIANGTVYLYASGKRDLYRRAVEYGLGLWLSAAAREAATARQNGARAGFEALFRASYTYLAAEPRLKRVLAEDPSLFPGSIGPAHADGHFQAASRRSVDMLEEAIVCGIASDEFCVADPRAAAELIFLLFRSMIDRDIRNRNDDGRRLFEASLSILLDGMVAR